jgi:phosphatidate cytidylyltransferase
MLRHRMIFGPLMIAGILAIVWLDGRLDTWRLTGFWQDVFLGREHPPAGLGFVLLAVILIPVASREVARMLRSVGIPGHTRLISIASIVAAMAMYATPRELMAPTGATIVATVLLAAFLVTLAWHSRDENPKGVIAAAGATMFTIALLGLMLGFYLAIRRWHSGWVVVAVILIVKSGDIGAYFTGRAFGRHKLIPWLSPGKTWEGLAGAVGLSIIVAIGFAWISQLTDVTEVWRTIHGRRDLVIVRYSKGWAAIAGLLFALVGHVGDLMVSLLKRDAGLKDSGRSIPGFGGVLDVLDSPLLVAPVAFWLLEAAEKG